MLDLSSLPPRVAQIIEAIAANANASEIASRDRIRIVIDCSGSSVKIRAADSPSPFLDISRSLLRRSA